MASATRTTAGLLQVVVLVLVACGDDAADAATPGGDEGAAGSRVPGGGGPADQLLDAFCEVLDRCCPPEGPTCDATAFDQLSAVQALRAGTVTTPEPAFSACMAALREEAVTCMSMADVTRNACMNAFAGTLAEGERCEHGVECAHGDALVMCWKLGDPAGPEPQYGTCRTLVAARLGERCFLSATGSAFSGGTITQMAEPSAGFGYCDLDEGLRCSASATCSERLAEGTACRTPIDCAVGLYCDRTCQRQKPNGSACSSVFECETGLLCDGTRCLDPSELSFGCDVASAVPLL